MKVNSRKPGAGYGKRYSSFEPDELATIKVKKQPPFSFVLDELSPLGVTAKPMFGFFYIYLDGKLIMLLRERENQPERNGLWLATTSEDLKSLSEEFPLLPRICVIDTGKNAWVFLPSKHKGFESYALRVCELVAGGDSRIGGSNTRAMDFDTLERRRGGVRSRAREAKRQAQEGSQTALPDETRSLSHESTERR